MTQIERENLRKKIEKVIVETKEKVAQLEVETQPIAPENSIGRISRMDAINNKSVAEAALRSAKAKLSKLKLALSSVDQPDFGKCSRCGNAIQPGRLMYMPESTQCIRCAGR